MGHLVGKDVYRKLGDKIDGLSMRVPWTESMHGILRELYSPDEADLIVRMPFGFSTVDRIVKGTGMDANTARKLLDGLADKGLVMDFNVEGKQRYAPSPMIIGIFEFTMMRTDDHMDRKKISALFHEYMQNEEAFYSANFARGKSMPIMRTLAYEESLRQTDHVEILDYEKAVAIVEQNGIFAMGLCSCRHEKRHLGHECGLNAPPDNCSSFGAGADYLVRHGMARKVSKTEMLENVARSKELGLVINADNVQQHGQFFCHCCGDCCNVLTGFKRFGYTSVVLSSNFIANTDYRNCKGCARCSRACPVEAITMEPETDTTLKRKKHPRVDESVCIGCGVCASRCKTESMKLDPRKQRVFTPETIFRRVILECLDRGTLQNQLFDNPQSRGQAFLRSLFGGFLKLTPVKRALMSKTLRSRFLTAMEKGVKAQGQSWVTRI